MATGFTPVWQRTIPSPPGHFLFGNISVPPAMVFQEAPLWA